MPKKEGLPRLSDGIQIYAKGKKTGDFSWLEIL
jgi:hypothetical protein